TIAELATSWDNITVAAAEHGKKEKAKHTPWPSLSSAKLRTPDEQLGFGLPYSSQGQRQPGNKKTRTAELMHGRSL
ncbi:hypothetical protein Dimus_018111, partial [Dionaea muscipula]